MALDHRELDDFYRFAKENPERGTLDTLEEALREFRNQQNEWRPRTPLGRRLKELREQFIAEGGTLLTPEEIDAEVKVISIRP